MRGAGTAAGRPRAATFGFRSLSLAPIHDR
jgi:hypothetical protein